MGLCVEVDNELKEKGESEQANGFLNRTQVIHVPHYDLACLLTGQAIEPAE